MELLHCLITLLLSVLAGLGVGSGGLYLVWLREGRGLSGGLATVGNLAFFTAALLSAFFIHLRRGRIDGGFFFTILVFGIPGAFLGNRIGAAISDTLLRAVLGVFLVFSGIFSFLLLKEKKVSRPSSLDKRTRRRYNKSNK